MRKFVMTLVMAGLICLPIMAQFPFGGMIGKGMDGNMLLTNKDVQKELKLTEDQIKTITDARNEMMQAMRAAFQEGDREAITKAQEEQTKTLKKLRDGFTSAQKKRLFELEIQMAVRSSQPSIFAREDVQKALNMTEKQKETVKSTLSGLEQDVKEVFEDAQGDREKLRGIMTKITGLSKDSFTKITKSFTDEQKKTWKEMQGEEFKGEFMTNPFGKGGKKKRDDF